MTCSFLFLSKLNMVESYLVFLSKHCKLYTKDISYYFCVYKEGYFIAFINHLYHSSMWRVHVSWAGCWLTSSLSHLCGLHGVRSVRNGWAALGGPAFEWQQHCSLQLKQHAGLETARRGALLATWTGQCQRVWRTQVERIMRFGGSLTLHKPLILKIHGPR